MKQALLLCFVCLLFLNACENPLDLKQPEFADVEDSSPFETNLYYDGNGFSPGYNSGLIRSDRITLKWQKCTDPNFLVYRLFRNGNHIKSFAKVDSVLFLDHYLQPDQTYTYQLQTFIKNGMAEASVMQLKTPSFASPSNLDYTYLSSSSLKLTWTDNCESATRYRVEKTDSNKDVNVFLTDTPYFIDNQVQEGNTYSYRVMALNNYEETDYSQSVSIYFHYFLSAPSLNNPVQMHPGNNVLLSWYDYSTAETAFQIYRSDSISGNYARIGETDANILSFLDTSQKLIGNTYYYFIRALNSQEQMDSNILSITITQQTFQFFDFEADNGGFSSNDASGWAHGNAYWTNAYSGSNIWGTTLAPSYYPNNANYILTTPSITISAGAVLSFQHLYYIEGYYDGGCVQISTNAGATWQTIQPYGGYPYGEIASLEGAGYSGEYWGWHPAEFDLSQYANQTIKLRWKFASGGNGQAYGWFIDDVMVGNHEAMTKVSLEESCKK